MLRWRAAAAVTSILIAAALGVSAKAQLSSSGRGPIDITADQADVENAKCLTTWRGAAEALQGQTRLRADVIRAFLKPRGVDAQGQPSCGATNRIEAEGNVYYVTPTQIAHGARAVYTADDDLIVMTGDVIVLQGKNVARGDRLVIHLATHQAEMESAAKGLGRTGRVRGVFYPNQPGSPGAPAAAPAAARTAP